MSLQDIEKKITKIREEIDTTASEEVKQLIDELELRQYQLRCILELSYSKENLTCV